MSEIDSNASVRGTTADRRIHNVPSSRFEYDCGPVPSSTRTPMPKPMSLANNRLRCTGTAVLTVALVCAMVAPLKYELDAHPRKHALRQCQVALSQLLARIGVDGTVPASRTASRAGGVMALETALAHSQLYLTRLSD
jgi:hypothetical protein